MEQRISSKCEEIPDLPYDDGAKTLFLYTKGTEGNPPEELKKLLSQVIAKVNKGMGVSEIADMLEEDETTISRLVQIVTRHAPEYDPEKILDEALKER